MADKCENCAALKAELKQRLEQAAKDKAHLNELVRHHQDHHEGRTWGGEFVDELLQMKHAAEDRAERAETLAALVPEPLLLSELADAVSQASAIAPEGVRQKFVSIRKQARALAGRIKKARGQETGSGD